MSGVYSYANMSKFNCIYSINHFISQTYCQKAEDNLSDTSLQKTYMNTPSCKQRVKTLQANLEALSIPDEFIANIVNDTDILSNFCIPAGTKGAIRGYEFNRLVQEEIVNIVKSFPDNKRFNYNFEKKPNVAKSKIHEIPDWYIYDNVTKKTLIGMNQLDLWSGGQQTNRAAKYILNEDLHKNKNIKIVSVVCKNYKLQSEVNKVYRIFQVGFEKSRLCYLGNLTNIINDYFNPTQLD
jgi:hypothetical protein